MDFMQRTEASLWKSSKRENVAKTSLKKQMVDSKSAVAPSTNCCAFCQSLFSPSKKADRFLSESVLLLGDDYIFQPYFPIAICAKQVSINDVATPPPPTKEL